MKKFYKGLNPASKQISDIDRFSWFSQGYLGYDIKRDIITDIRYSMLPNDTLGLWGIRLNKDLNNFLTVQFFASKDSINFNNKNLNEDLIFNIYENNLFKYFYGKTLTYSDAKNIQNKMKLNGFFDSFIVGFINGKKTNLNKVLTILDE